MQKSVCIYRTTIPHPSETFVLEQAKKLSKYDYRFCARTQLSDQSDYKISAIGGCKNNKLKQHLFALTNFPFLLPSEIRNGKFNLIHAHFGTDGVMVIPLAEKLKIPLVVTFHGFDATTSLNSMIFSGKPYLMRYAAMRHRLIKRVSRIIAVSDYIKKRLIDNGFPEGLITRHYIGVDVDKFTPSDQLATNDQYILSVARHTEVKGIDIILKAFAKVNNKFKNVKLIQVGSGPLTDKLKNLSRELGILDRVYFVGDKTQDEIVELMQGARIFVMSGKTTSQGNQEGLGMVVIESSACGIPVIATHYGGIPEAVLDGKTGLFFREGDISELAYRLEFLLQNESLAKQMGQEGRLFVMNNFNIIIQTKILESIYDNVCQKYNYT